MRPLKKIAFLINRNKEGAPGLAEQLIKVAGDKGAVVKSTDAFPVPAGFLDGQDACCVIGGDGTLLSIVGESSRAGVPVIGVNRGNLGFLTTVAAGEAMNEFSVLIDGHYKVANRSMLQCEGKPGTAAKGGLALNDIVIKAEKSGRLVALEVQVDDRLVTEFLCDGLIFSTPTGSTAYNLSAGGPIIEPDAKVIAMTPICPHTLSNRTVIFRESARILVHNPFAAGRLSVTLDGKHPFLLDPSQRLLISISGAKLPLIQGRDHSHFSVVRTKLGWIGGRKELGPSINR